MINQIISSTIQRKRAPLKHVLCKLAAIIMLAAALHGAAHDRAIAQGTKTGTGALEKRIEQLEQQLVDMQVVIGTLQSLPQSTSTSITPAPSYGVATGPDERARLDGMETQIRALTAQIEQMAEQLRRVNASSGRQGALGNPQRQPQGAPLGQDTRLNSPSSTAALADGFGSTTVTPSQGAPGQQPTDYDSLAAIDPRANAGSDPRKKYETAYGYLLQQQYGAAENAFRDFLKTHGRDPLAGNAQYWLGETYYVRGQYKSAANEFLKGYETFASSKKAPDSLLKLAMSLDRLGHKDAACSSLSELGVKFPQAPSHVKQRAANEKIRVGC